MRLSFTFYPGQRALKFLLPECCNISSRRKAARVVACSWDKKLRTKFPVPAAGRV